MYCWAFGHCWYTLFHLFWCSSSYKSCPQCAFQIAITRSRESVFILAGNIKIKSCGRLCDLLELLPSFVYMNTLSLSYLICTSWKSSFERVCKNNVVIIRSSNFLCLDFGSMCKESQKIVGIFWWNRRAIRVMVNILLIGLNTLEKFVPICCIKYVIILSWSSDSSMLWGHAHLYALYHGLVLSQCPVGRSLTPGFRPLVFGPPIYWLMQQSQKPNNASSI